MLKATSVALRSPLEGSIGVEALWDKGTKPSPARRRAASNMAADLFGVGAGSIPELCRDNTKPCGPADDGVWACSPDRSRDLGGELGSAKG